MENITKLYCISRAMSTNKVFLALLKANLPFETTIYYAVPPAEICNIFHRVANTDNQMIQAPITIIDGKTFTGGWSASWYICEKYLPELVQGVELINYLEWAMWAEPMYSMLGTLHHTLRHGSNSESHPVRKHHLSEFRTFNRLIVLNNMLKESDYLYNNRRSIYDLALFSFIWPIKESTAYDKIWNTHSVTDSWYRLIQDFNFNDYTYISSWYDRMKGEYMADAVSVIKTTLPELHETSPKIPKPPPGEYTTYVVKWQPTLSER